jgi:ADP-heptose:LPS heptosyltransferase
VTPSKPSPAIKSLLIIKPSSLGDIVHALQVLQSVARQQPDLRITWVVRDRFAGLVEAAPFVSEVILFKRKEGFRAIWNVMKALRARHFDAVWDMQGLLRSGLMTAAARSSKKWGRSDSREGAGLFYNKRIPLPPGEGPHHAIAVLQGFPQAAGFAPQIELPLVLKPAPAFPWQSFFASDPTLNFVIFTDSRGVEKEWKGFSDLTRLIWEKIPGSRVAWCAGQPASPDGEIPGGRFLNLTGCPFDEMLALARQPSVFIGNDSGPMHLSAASGNRVLAIFGPTSPLRFGPWPIGSARTRPVVAPGGILADLKAETVLEALQELRTRE